jgi:hypothetical protein
VIRSANNLKEHNEVLGAPLLGRHRSFLEIPRTLSHCYLPKRFRFFLELSMCTGSVLAVAFSEDRVTRTFFSFLATYSGGRIIGERLEVLLNKKIIELETQEENADALRRAANATSIVFHMVLIPILFVPFSPTYTYARSKELIVVGMAAGLGDGFRGAIQERRLSEIPTEQLEELQKSQHFQQHGTTWRISATAFPVLAMVGFTSWQMQKLNDAVERGELLTLSLSFLLTFGGCFVADGWEFKTDQEERSCKDTWRDHAICYLVDPTPFFISPAYIFAALTNAMELNDEAIESQSKWHRALSGISWGSYGHAMAIELYKMLTARKLPEDNKLFWVNAMLTVIRKFQGKLP